MSRRAHRSTSNASAAVPGPRTHVVLVHHDPARSRATLLPIAIGAGTPRPLARREAGKVVAIAEPWRRKPDGLRALAAHDGGTRAVAVEGEGATLHAEVIALDGGTSRSIPLARKPSSLLLQGSTLLLGEAGGVSYVDLDGVAAPRPIVTRPDMGAKAYDVLVSDGDLAFAIDDVVMPTYGDSIRLGPVPAHVAGFDLPGIINGSYRLAAFVGAGGDVGTLYVVAPFGHMGGWGQYLAALPVVRGRVVFAAGSLLGSLPSELEEFVSRDTGRPEKLLAGDHLTDLTGLAVARRDGVPFRVVLAAGDRGLLVLPLELRPGTRAKAIDLGAPCTDVLADSGRVWALAGETLVELATTARGLTPVRRTALPSRYDAFVH